MALRIRTTKFRHVYGAQCRREQTFENVRITRNTHDSNFCSVNPRFLAIVTESSGGGAFAVLDVNRPGRVDINCPRVCGHAGAILDVKWNPFNDCVVASASDDASVKIWTIPETGLVGTLTDWSADLHGHSRRVSYLEWHPTAANVLMSVGFDYKVMVWNAEQAEPITSLACHNDTVFSISWGRDGALISTTCKDKKIRVLDPRSAQVAMETNGHQSAKASKSVFVSDDLVFTTGFSRNSDRQYALWDVRKAGTPITQSDIDCSSGILLPYYDPDIHVVYLAGKGDGNIRYFEIVPDDQSVHFLNAYQSPLPQRGLGMMPKRGIDPLKNEVARFYKLHASKNLVEPVSMIVPRKAEGFQHDVFPPTASQIPSLTADEWTSGLNRGPILVDLEEGTIVDKPRSSMSPAVQPQLAALSKAPQITTYKAVGKQPPTFFNPAPAGYTPAPTGFNPAPSKFAPTSTAMATAPGFNHYTSAVGVAAATSFQPRVSPPVTLRTSPEGHAPVYTGSPTKTGPSPVSEGGGGGGPGFVNGRYRTQGEPASIKNIKRLSMNYEEDTGSDSSLPSSQVGSPASSVCSVQGRISRLQGSQPSLVSPASPSSLYPVNGFSAEAPAASDHAIHVRKVWSPPAPPTASPSPPPAAHHQMAGGLTSPGTDPELKKAYFRQLEEIRSLQEQLQLKDRRIKLLEAELSQMRERDQLGPGQSDC